MTDPRLMPKKERTLLIEKCRKLGVNLLHEEKMFPFPYAQYRLEKAKFSIDFKEELEPQIFHIDNRSIVAFTPTEIL